MALKCMFFTTANPENEVAGEGVDYSVE